MKPYKIIPVVFSTNEKYAPFADVCIESIYANSSKSCFYEITIFHTDLSAQTINKLKSKLYDNISVNCLDVSDLLANISDKLYSHSYFSKEMYYRILIPRCFKDYNKVIYLDCDMIVLGDIEKLYDIDLGDNMIGACRNLMHTQMHDYIINTLHINPINYFNSGMLVFNIKKCLELENRLWSIINSYGTLLYPDQDLLNLVCENNVFYLDISWNWLFHLERLQSSKNKNLHLSEDDWQMYQATKPKINILHYTGDQKPWDYNALPMAEFFWKYASKSNFFEKINDINAKTNKPKFILQFIDFRKNQIVINCCLILPRLSADSCKIIVNGKISSPCYSYLKVATYKNNLCVQKYFNISIIRKNLQEQNQIYLTFNSAPLLFEYGKFFPLNGIRSSYFRHSNLLIYRSNKQLIIEKNTTLRKFHHEINYALDIIKSENVVAKKSLWIRYAYLLLKPFVRSKIILINDRPEFAGDNGEAMFKYLNELKPAKIKPYFVISKDSKDYRRLKKIGHVVPTHSYRLKILNLFATAKLSSQTDYDVYTIFDGNYVKDILYKTKKVFLQHGITKDDISDVYSRYFQGFDLFITAAQSEYRSIIENKAYGCPPAITKLTGFARHDLLVDNKENIILIAPTWRKNLLSDIKNGTITNDFTSSQFYLQYKNLLSNKELKSYLKDKNFKIYFVLHNMMRKALPYFEPFFDDVVENAMDKPYAELFSKSSIMITDYSSNAFEFAYLKKPIIYFQIDNNAFFEQHTYTKGYFDYEKDGFGPVITSEKTLVDNIISIINNDCSIDEQYLQRIKDFFAYSDQNNRKRIWEEIKNVCKLHC